MADYKELSCQNKLDITIKGLKDIMGCYTAADATAIAWQTLKKIIPEEDI